MSPIDVASTDIRHPLQISTAIDGAGDLDELRLASALVRPTAVQLHDAGVPAGRNSSLVGAMVDAIVTRCVSFEQAVGSAAEHASWLVLGSLARNEPPLLRR